MKVFISWSGEPSRKVAEALYSWLPNVLQSVDPFLSSESIPKGDRWQNTIARSLNESAFGIICLTPGNLSAPWINYEAGALGARFEESHVSPFLHGLKAADIVGPLASFNAASSDDREEVLRLVKSINTASSAPILDDLLKKCFDRWWGDLEQELSGISPGGASRTRPQASTRPSEDKIDELLVLVRELSAARRTPTGLDLERAVDRSRFNARLLRNHEISDVEPRRSTVNEFVHWIERDQTLLPKSDRARIVDIFAGQRRGTVDVVSDSPLSAPGEKMIYDLASREGLGVNFRVISLSPEDSADV